MNTLMKMKKLLFLILVLFSTNVSGQTKSDSIREANIIAILLTNPATRQLLYSTEFSQYFPKLTEQGVLERKFNGNQMIFTLTEYDRQHDCADTEIYVCEMDSKMVGKDENGYFDVYFKISNSNNLPVFAILTSSNFIKIVYYDDTPNKKYFFKK